MNAVVIHAAHDLRIDTLPTPAPGPGQVLVRMERGGICGSDLHYFHEGRIGTIVLAEPMVLGHEVAGRIAALGPGVEGVKVGTRVAVNPSRPCNRCRYCLEGRQMHCLDMRFYGSAMRKPHIQGAFRTELVAEASQCHVVPDTIPAAAAAMAEPLAVCLHAVNRAGPLLGRRVLVTGCGPIGALSVLAARLAGAAEIVVTDVTSTPFEIARAFGATAAIDMAADPQRLARYEPDKGYFDVLLECSGNERALTGALAAVRPQGTIVQVGLGGSFTLPINIVVAKELELIGTFRFHEEFALAVGLIASKRVDLSPLLSATYPFREARTAFEHASDRKRAMKVQLAFDMV
jgi:L-idonate 5-dehydrogenase